VSAPARSDLRLPVAASSRVQEQLLCAAMGQIQANIVPAEVPLRGC